MLGGFSPQEAFRADNDSTLSRLTRASRPLRRRPAATVPLRPLSQPLSPYKTDHQAGQTRRLPTSALRGSPGRGLGTSFTHPASQQPRWLLGHQGAPRASAAPRRSPLPGPPDWPAALSSELRLAVIFVSRGRGAGCGDARRPGSGRCPAPAAAGGAGRGAARGSQTVAVQGGIGASWSRFPRALQPPPPPLTRGRARPSAFRPSARRGPRCGVWPLRDGAAERRPAARGGRCSR